MPDEKLKIGEVIECAADEVATRKPELAARLPKGATLSTVTKAGKARITVVKESR